ncbi:T9SS type A sorting domain-containing protein [Candidatus Marinimicrobia bacterium]|nr:T9SS type A sorting domain-containing protein [Candidatus Neomarinimicrobiota bacterium]
MKKTIILTIIPLFFNLLKADAIELSTETLDFGNVLMGNSPTMTFTVTAELEQTITITAPNYFTVDVTEIQATDGLTQDIVVTFSPPSIGTYDSYVTLTGSVFGSAAVAVNAIAVNNIEGSLSGTITAEFSPYEISGDIWVEEGNTLTINPGVTFEFLGDYNFVLNGVLTAVGTYDSLITFRSSISNNNGWDGLVVDNSESEIEFISISEVDPNTIYDNYIDINFDSQDVGSVSIDTHGSGEGLSTNFYHSYPNSFYFNSGSGSQIPHNINFNDSLYVNDINASVELMYKWDTNVQSQDYIRLYVNGNQISSISPIVSTSFHKAEFNLGNFIYQKINLRIVINRYGYDEHYIDDIKVNGVGKAGITVTENLELNNSSISNSGTGIYARGIQLDLKNSVVSQNVNQGVSFINSQVSLINSIVYSNNLSGTSGDQIKNFSGGLSISFSCVQNLSGLGVSGNWSNGGGNIESSPFFTDESFHLDPLLSPCIDSGYSNDFDDCLPPGLGTIQADIGMYGGNGNCGAGDSNLGSGIPNIVSIQDLPQDQGGYVGLQYNASPYDSEIDIYDITYYSYWREMDTEASMGVEFDLEPTSSYYRPNMRTQNGWEYIGESPAQQFEIYGYSAPTLADSTASDGIFWSKYLVVAHTNYDDVFFVSEPDSGYSVDNIAPYAPQNIQVQTGEYGATLSWEVVEENIDIAFYEVYKDDVLHSQITETIFVDSVGYGSSSIFTIRGVDENGNVGEFSDPFEVSTGTLGDVTWDGTIDVLDVLNIADIIMSGVSGFTEGELWASDLNVDGSTDVFDLMQLVDHIMGGASASRTGSNNTPTAIYTEAGSLYLSSSNPVQGLELVLSDYLEEVSNKTDLIFHHVGNKILIYSMGDKVLSGDKIELFTLPEGVHIISAKVSGPAGERYETTLGVIPKAFTVHQNYPNPFNPSTSIQIDVPEITNMKVMVFDATGREIQTIENAEFSPGYHTLTWNGSDQSGRQVASGIYFIQVTTRDYSKTIKSMLLR